MKLHVEYMTVPLRGLGGSSLNPDVEVSYFGKEIETVEGRLLQRSVVVRQYSNLEAEQVCQRVDLLEQL